MQAELILWAAQLVLIPYAIFRRKEQLLYSSTILFFMLLIPIFIGLNTPNPNNVIIIQVTVP